MHRKFRYLIFNFLVDEEFDEDEEDGDEGDDGTSSKYFYISCSVDVNAFKLLKTVSLIFMNDQLFLFFLSKNRRCTCRRRIEEKS